MSDSVVSVETVSKKFCRGLKRGMLYTMQDVARDMIGVRAHSDSLRQEEFWAVKDLSFDLAHGESLGLLGTNGAGKSTLLKILNGIIRPDIGQITMKGRIGALIEVGAGFHPMLTGRENIYINGAILGMTKRELDGKFDDIVSFSGLSGEILDAPVKTYSSGMYVRLGFSVAIHCDPDVLLVDEVLAVGDSAFRVRCSEWIAGFLKKRGTLILVSHYLPSIRETCSKVLWMKNGECQFYGDTISGLQVYQNAISQPQSPGSPAGGGNVASGSPLQMTSVKLRGGDGGAALLEFEHGEPFALEVEIEARRDLGGCHLHLVFSNQEVGAVCGWTSRTLKPEGLCLPQGHTRLRVDLGAVDFVPGNYSVTAYLSDLKHLADYHEFVGPQFGVRPHPVVDSRFGQTMLKGTIHAL